MILKIKRPHFVEHTCFPESEHPGVQVYLLKMWHVPDNSWGCSLCEPIERNRCSRFTSHLVTSGPKEVSHLPQELSSNIPTQVPSRSLSCCRRSYRNMRSPYARVQAPEDRHCDMQRVARSRSPGLVRVESIELRYLTGRFCCIVS